MRFLTFFSIYFCYSFYDSAHLKKLVTKLRLGLTAVSCVTLSSLICFYYYFCLKELKIKDLMLEDPMVYVYADYSDCSQKRLQWIAVQLAHPLLVASGAPP